MDARKYIKIAWKEIRRRKLRSFLTLIGVIIGISAIVSLITLGQGLENAIEEQLSALGNDKLFITAKGNTLTPGISTDAVKIDEDDLEFLRDIDGVKKATGAIFSTADIEFNNLVRFNFISGMPTDLEERKLIGEAQSYTIARGRTLDKGDKFKVVVGHSYSEDIMYEKELDVGDKILIKNREFKVIGILEKIGSPPDDQSVLIPIDTYQEIFDSGEELGLLVAQSEAGEDVSKIGKRIEEEMREFRGLEEGKEDINVETPIELAAGFTNILNIVKLVIVGIAGISLLVGGIGIMNTMYTSVLQRTKEIGIMKALGAQNKDILWLFIVESGFYGLIGGVLGIALGFGFAKFVEQVFILAVGPAFLSIQVDYLLLIGTLAFAFFVGTLSGIAPARQASKMDPVESLRYE